MSQLERGSAEVCVAINSDAVRRDLRCWGIVVGRGVEVDPVAGSVVRLVDFFIISCSCSLLLELEPWPLIKLIISLIALLASQLKRPWFQSIGVPFLPLLWFNSIAGLFVASYSDPFVLLPSTKVIVGAIDHTRAVSRGLF